MAVTPPNPHDALFRRVLSRPANAIGELRSALPTPVADRIDWNSLTTESCSFVSTELRSRYSDLLFRTRLAGHDAYIYLLVEHQSRPDRFMPLRMAEYLVSIWNRYLEEHPHTRTLPAVIPLVVHSAAHGRPWNTPTELSELIDLDPGTRTTLGDHVPSLRLFLDDLTTVDLETLRERPLTPAARLVFVFHKIVPGNAHLGTDLLAQIPDLQAVIEAPGSLDDLRSLVKYIFLVGETSEDDLAPVIDQLGPRAKEVVMTTAEQLRAKGHAEGLAEGQAEALTDLLTIKFGPLPIEVTDQIAKAEVTQLRTWLRNVLTATTLDEVFDHA